MVTVYDFGIKMKRDCTLHIYTLIGYIPKGYCPGATINVSAMSHGEYIGLIQFHSNGNIYLYPIVSHINKSLHFSATYCNI